MSPVSSIITVETTPPTAISQQTASLYSNFNYHYMHLTPLSSLYHKTLRHHNRHWRTVLLLERRALCRIWQLWNRYCHGFIDVYRPLHEYGGGKQLHPYLWWRVWSHKVYHELLPWLLDRLL
jgi:hypothetical protein